MSDYTIELAKNKKIFFASDLHLGLSGISRKKEIEREKKIVRWLNLIEKEAQVIFFVGDIFDFWFEYRHTVPKGYIRILGKIAQLVDRGIEVIFFTGNHDLWMCEYFQEELGIPVHKQSIEIVINGKAFLVGHGDGLGPGDNFYKILKKIFTNKIAQWLFRWLHPDIGISLAKRWSKSSRRRKKGFDEKFLGEKEYLIQYCRMKEKEKHRDYYVFGHRHMSLEFQLSDDSRYINIGEWVNKFTYGMYDGKSFGLRSFKDIE